MRKQIEQHRSYSIIGIMVPAPVEVIIIIIIVVLLLLLRSRLEREGKVFSCRQQSSNSISFVVVVVIWLLVVRRNHETLAACYGFSASCEPRVRRQPARARTKRDANGPVTGAVMNERFDSPPAAAPTTVGAQ